ncbi:YgaP family membrane protein [Halosimplex sp. J119]
MESNVGGRDRLARGIVAVLCTVLAVKALASGNRSRGLVLGIAAVGMGFNAVTCFCGLNRALGIDTTAE